MGQNPTLMNCDLAVLDGLIARYLRSEGFTQCIRIMEVESGTKVEEPPLPDVTLDAVLNFATATRDGVDELSFNRTPEASQELSRIAREMSMPPSELVPELIPDPAEPVSPATVFKSPKWEAVWGSDTSTVCLTPKARPSKQDAKQTALCKAGFEVAFSLSDVQQASIEHIVKALTSPSIDVVSVQPYFAALVLSYRALGVTADDLFTLLMMRYRTLPYEQKNAVLSDMSYSSYSEYARLVHHNVGEFLFAWMCHSASDFGIECPEKSALLQRLLSFCEGELIKDDAPMAKRLRALIARQLSGQSVDVMETDQCPATAPLSPLPADLMTSQTVIVAGKPVVAAAELARQLTVRDSGLFLAVKPYQLIEAAGDHASPITKALSPVFQSLVLHSEFSSLVLSSILVATTPEDALQAYVFWIDVAYELRRLFNVFSLSSVAEALSNPILQKLRLKEKLDSTYTSRLDKLQEYANTSTQLELLQLFLREPDTAFIPYVGAFVEQLRTLFTSAAPHPSGTPAGTANWQTCLEIERIVTRCMALQIQRYSIIKVPTIHYWLESLPRLSDEKISQRVNALSS